MNMSNNNEIISWINSKGLTIVDKDLNRPWGGFLVISEAEAMKFAKEFFNDTTILQLVQGKRLCPKILMVNPNKRLSWQYHRRRSELWSVIQGPVAVATSPNDVEQRAKVFHNGDLIKLECGYRHRLIGIETIGIVAEFWVHTNPEHLSDEDDIIRLQDDFIRK
jgi:mannose-6-phosphate isomerase